MLHHLSVAVADLAVSRAFYDPALLALGYVPVWADATAVGYGAAGGGDTFAIKLRARPIIAGDGFHVAFSATSRPAVDAFYRSALANGGRDHGGVGLHPEYGPNYYAAFVFDPDGHRIEAVINVPVQPSAESERPYPLGPAVAPGC